MYYNHDRNMENRRSHSVIIIYVNNVPIIRYIKHHNTVEASSFGSEFFALRVSTETLEDMRYKLICFGVPLDDPAQIFF